MTGSAAAVAWPSPVLPKFKAGETPLHLDNTQISWVVSLFYLGNLAAPIPAGYLSDRFGRKRTLFCCSFLQVISWILILFSNSVVLLYLARFLGGLYYGLAATVQPIYIGEYAQPNLRASLGSLNQFMFGVGNLLPLLIGPYVSYTTLAAVLFVLPFLFVLTFWYMPESPYYSIMKENVEEAKKSLCWLRGNPNEVKLQLELNQIKSFVEKNMKKPGSFRDVFATKASRKAMTISFVFAALKRLSGVGVVTAFATVTLPDRTFKILSPNECVIILGIVSLVSSLAVASISDKFGRKTLLVISYLGCAFSAMAVAVWYFLDSKTNFDARSVSFVPFVSFFFQFVSYHIACGPSGFTVKSELFSPNVKSKSSALATIVLAGTSFLLNKFYLIISEWEGIYLNFLIFSLACFVGVAFVILYVPETRGKTLEEIQDILNGVKNCKPTMSDNKHS